MNKNVIEEKSDILIYQAEDGKTRIDVRLEDETVWLTQMTMVELYQATKQNISLHLKNIYEEGELEREATVKEYLTVRQEGRRKVERRLEYYNLEAIIAVGYRIRSHRGTQFRRWATGRLREYLVKGFVMDDRRLKEGRNLGADYFDELLERIRDIRASEKRFYRKITDIYKLSVDYEPASEITKAFFATIQNKLHWAVHGHTAAELIAERADAGKSNMGLTSWKGAKVRRADVTTAKNCLNENELKSLNRIVTMYLDYAEDQAERRQPVFMHDWVEKLNAFLQFNGREVLEHPGTVSAEVAKTLALQGYNTFNTRRLTEESEQPDSDFERVVKEFQGKS
ncbi:MAG: virulence RhuM family protein [bacterium]|nr:virulence RhuM family protein [bacterium]